MSVNRTTSAELCAYIQEKCSTILGNRFWDCRLVIPVECGTKPEKLDSRIFAASKFRLFIINGKTVQSLKVERYFHILSIRSVQIINDNDVCFGLDENTTGKRRLFVHSDTPSKELTMMLLTGLKHYFPDFGEIIRMMVELSPPDLYTIYGTLPVSVPLLACRSFRRSYAALCDYYDQPFREEVVWDIEKIYASHRLRVLRLEDFTHLLPRDLLPIVSVCQYSTFFTGICIDGIKLMPELVEIILAVVKRSRTLRTLILRNCSLPRDFINLFSTSLQLNLSVPLEYIDFSKNILDDKKGFVALNALLSKLSQLRTVVLSECGISEKSINLLAAGLMQGVKPNNGLKQLQINSLDLSGNTIKDDVNDLLQFISLCESLRSLNLSDSGFNVDKLWGTLRFGGLQLETLKLSGCQCNRRNKEGMQNMKEYFGSAVGLKYIDFSNTILGADMLKHLLLGLVNNQQLKPFTLVLDGIADKGVLQVLESSLGDIDAKSLSLRDNGLEADGLSILVACNLMSHLTRLDLSGANFTNLKRSAKHHGTLTNVVLQIVKLIGEEDSKLTDLFLIDCRLGSHLSVLLNALGVSSSLRHLDVSGNEMGNFGARLLAKALQVNTSLRSVVVDRNQITGDGYADIAHALSLNTTLTGFPYPISDAADALGRTDRGKTLSALSEIEAAVNRNRDGIKRGEAYYRAMLGSLQQELFGKTDSAWRISQLSEEFSEAIESLPSVGERGESLVSLVHQCLTELEEKVTLQARANLAPFVHIAEAENIEYNYHYPEKNCSFRESAVNTVVDYLSEIKWKIIGRTIEQILLELRTLDTTEGRQSASRTPMRGAYPELMASLTIAAQKLNQHVDVEEDAENMETQLNLEGPPLPSQLIHFGKSRPRPNRNVKNGKTSDNEEGKCLESPASEKSSRISDCSQKDEKAPVAMPRSTSIQTSSPPPIVPRRNRVGPSAVPPTLPPKPGSSGRRPPSDLDEKSL